VQEHQQRLATHRWHGSPSGWFGEQEHPGPGIMQSHEHGARRSRAVVPAPSPGHRGSGDHARVTGTGHAPPDSTKSRRRNVGTSLRTARLAVSAKCLPVLR